MAEFIDNTFTVEIGSRRYPLKNIKATAEPIIRAAEKEINNSIAKFKASKSSTKDEVDMLAITALDSMVKFKLEQEKNSDGGLLSDSLTKTIDMLDEVLSEE